MTVTKKTNSREERPELDGNKKKTNSREERPELDGHKKAPRGEQSRGRGATKPRETSDRKRYAFSILEVYHGKIAPFQ